MFLCTFLCFQFTTSGIRALCGDPWKERRQRKICWSDGLRCLPLSGSYEAPSDLFSAHKRCRDVVTGEKIRGHMRHISIVEDMRVCVWRTVCKGKSIFVVCKDDLLFGVLIGGPPHMSVHLKESFHWEKIARNVAFTWRETLFMKGDCRENLKNSHVRLDELFIVLSTRLFRDTSVTTHICINQKSRTYSRRCN